ncbi:MAG: hypothetical protein AAFR17_19960 [Pseudomonadota bacterium]
MPKGLDKTAKFGLRGEQKYMTDRHPVENEAGSGKRPCKCCDSWIAHWINNSGAKRARCAYLGCGRETEHGAHLRFYDIDKQRFHPGRWLVPLCATHNNPNQKNLFYIDKRCELVKEAKSSKCFRSRTEASRATNFEIVVRDRKPKLACACPDALTHYRLVARSKRARCAAVPCGAEAKTAIGVEVLGPGRKKLWLAPLCPRHAKLRDPIFIESMAALVDPKPDRACQTR